MPLLCALALFLVAPTFAGGDGDGHDSSAPHHARHADLFVGTADPAHHAAVALGADIEWRLSGLLGVAAFGDATLGEHPHGLVGAGVVVHPGAGLRLFAGPALALSEGHRDAAFRAGLGYDLHVGRFSVTPVAGFGFGTSF